MNNLLLGLSALSFYLFVHPYAVYPLTLRSLRERPISRSTGAPLPKATLVFSAFNEEAVLPSKLANIEAIKRLHPDLEVLAYSDMSQDRTLEILQSRPDLLHVIPATERTGKALGMRRMVAAASGEVCIYTDANVILEPSSVAPMLAYFSDPEVGGVSGTLRYTNENEGTTAEVGGLYWRLEERIKKLESRSGSIMGADGSIFATRRALYPEVPGHLMDDFTVSMSVLFHGLRLVSAPDVIAYEKNATSSKDEFRRKRRIACRAFNTHRHLWPNVRRLPALDVYKYISHKVLRWFGAPLLLVSAVSGSLALVLAGRAELAAAGWLLAVGAGLADRRLRLPGISKGVEIVRSIIATFRGVLDSLGGLTYQTWSPAQSRN